MRFPSFLIVAVLIYSVAGFTQSTSKAQVVVLGTGTPILDPDRSGPAVAVVVNGSAYLVDFGPGVVRRAAAAARDKKIAPSRLRTSESRLQRTSIQTTLPDSPISS